MAKKSYKRWIELDSRRPTYSGTRQAGQRTILGIDRSPQVMQKQLEVRLMAKKSYKRWNELDARRPTNSGARQAGQRTILGIDRSPAENAEAAGRLADG
jgi:hypothetical protein